MISKVMGKKLTYDKKKNNNKFTIRLNLKVNENTWTIIIYPRKYKHACTHTK